MAVIWIYNNYNKKKKNKPLYTLLAKSHTGVNGGYSKTAEVNIHLPADPHITAECRMFTWTELGLKQALQNPVLFIMNGLLRGTQIYKVHMMIIF